MNNHSSASKAHGSTRHVLNVTNIALVALAVVVVIMLMLTLLLLKPITNTSGVTTSATPAMTMGAPTSDY